MNLFKMFHRQSSTFADEKIIFSRAEHRKCTNQVHAERKTKENHFIAARLGLRSQRGAMFGLDARIALAIFGVLSVVAGATAVNVLGSAGTTALVTEMNNMRKAYQEFNLGTGDHTTRFMDLIDNSSDIIGWNGPYVDLLSNKSRQYGVYSLVEGRQDVPGVPPIECSDGGGICSIWLKLTGVKDSLAAKVDETLDAEISPNSGVLRVEFVPGGTDTVYFLLTARN